MQTPKEVFEAVNDRCRERGAQVFPRGVLGLSVGGFNAYISPPDFDALVLTFPAQRAGAAVIALADFAMEAGKIAQSDRLTASAKSADIFTAAKAYRTKLETILDEVGTALDAALAAEARDTVPLPIEPAAAADAVLDAEMRQYARQQPPHEQMKLVRDNLGVCRAVLRQPLGFEAAVIDLAKKAWATFNPNAPTATAAAQQAASWREARGVVGQCLACLSQLSAGRSGGSPVEPLSDTKPLALSLPTAA
jgi:hypothetical protein